MTGYEALRKSGAWIDLSARGKIRVTGTDRARLLHAMCTNDVRNLVPGSGLYAFFLDSKGRILVDTYIYNHGESLLLDTEPETGGKLRDHLDKYIIADDVHLEDESSQWACLGLEGPSSMGLATELGISVPDIGYAIQEWGDGFAAHVASTGTIGIRIFVPIAERDSVVQCLTNAGIPQASGEEARTVRIENGRPRYGEEISERYLVQETQVLNGVHFNKGCYLGQEIVERVRSRGQVHRMLSSVRIEGNATPAAGTKLTVNGEPVGEIASAVFSPASEEVVGLAYVKSQPLQDKPEMTVAGTDPPIRAYIR
jgi:folate-binding protein YgfZ